MWRLEGVLVGLCSCGGQPFHPVYTGLLLFASLSIFFCNGQKLLSFNHGVF